MDVGGMDDKRVNVLYADTLFLFFEGWCIFQAVSKA